MMTPSELVSREILRLARATQRSAFIYTRRLSDFYHLPEESVRQELAKLAEENRIRLAGWQSKEDFLEKAPEDAAVRVDLVD